MPQRSVIIGGKPPESISCARLPQNQEPSASGATLELKPHQVQAVNLVGSVSIGSRLIGDEMRCVSGKTIINVNRGGKGFSVPIDIAYQSIRKGWWDSNIPTKIRSLVNGEIRLQQIQQIHSSGSKWMLKITTERGKNLSLTKDHLVATVNGWKEAGDLSVGDEVLTNGYKINECSQCGSTKEIIKYKYAKFVGWCKECMYRYGRDNDSRGLGGRSIDTDGYVRISGQYNHPRAQNSGYQVKEHELVMEKYLGRYLLWPDEQVHHKDHNKQNNDISNLELLSPEEHGREHGDYSRFSMAKPKKDKIVAIESDGIWPVYDITMAGNHPNFVASGIIVHNCGKTPTAIAIDFRLRRETQRKQRGNNCTLIVCPKSVLDVWSTHLRWMGVADSQIFSIDLPSKQALTKRLGHIAENKRKADARAWYIIINWDAVQTVKKELLSAGPWFHIIGDEIHRIKGRETKRTKAFKKLTTKQKTGLSGTPADNRPEDFWSVLNWLKPRDFTSYWSFVDEYCTTFTTRSGFKKITGVRKSRLPALREKIAPYYIRRKLADVADSLPQKQYRTIYVEMSARQRKQYDEFEKKWIVEAGDDDIFAAFDIVEKVRLQQMAIGYCAVEDDDVHITDDPPSPKLNKVMELIEDGEESSGPYIVFAQHHDTVKLLSKRCQSKGITTASIIGTTGPDDRSIAVRDFQSGKREVFIGTIGACREGITLSRANSIIFVDKAWNPNWNRQAEARADSLDSRLPVTVITLETVNSIDQDRRLKINQKGSDTEAISSTGQSD